MSMDDEPFEMIHPDLADPRIQAAISELEGLILQRFPEATFDVGYGDDPDGIYIIATVDVEDTDEVMETFMSRMVDMQIDERLPVYVVPEWPLHRVREFLRQRREQQAQADKATAAAS